MPGSPGLPPDDDSPELATMIAAARTAGDLLIHHFRNRERLRVELKGAADFVSQADVESERLVRDALLGAYPECAFLAEESAAAEAGAGTAASAFTRARGESGAAAATERPRFIVDPLDGTTNFLHGIPHFAVSIALERGGAVVAGVVFDPAKDELFAGERGRGARLGREPLRVANDADLSGAVVGTGIPHVNRPEKHAKYLLQLGAVMREAAGVRRFAAAALDLAYVAAGRLSAFFEYGLSPWDVAAGSLLVREAGGTVTEPGGGADVLRTGDVLATNGRLHPSMQALLARALPPARQSLP
jgi:myo-inositol-1(or 4)-monophosphatase